MPERVCAVVVTFNRKNLLEFCLKSLLTQTRVPDQILVVDNASTDGTPDFVRQHFPELPFMRLDRNSGGAGGFHEGMKRAYEEGFDWIWVMDDDITMEQDALRSLLGYADVGDIINPRKLHAGDAAPWEAFWNTAGCYPMSLKRDESFANGKPWTTVTCANFEGALIRRVTIEKSGLPDVRYFIGGDDSMYGLRAQFHVRVIYVNHVAVIKNFHFVQPRSRMALYLGLRNRFLHYDHFHQMGIPVSRTAFLIQNVRDGISDTMEILRDPKRRNWLHFEAIWGGFRDGLRGRFGPPPWIR